jgi:16S rRNA (cytidine1402-2'-O)-methyltransferase
MPLSLPIHNTEKATGKGQLYVVATPIGNRADITLRALKILQQVDVIAAEDTRHTGRFLKYHNIESKLLSYHEHNEIERTPALIQRLKAGASVALVSSAGTPSLSDPGYRLIKAAINGDIKVTPIPGVSAAIAALSVSGLPTNSFVFIGFPPKKNAKRLKLIEKLAEVSGTLIFYESPKRILKLVEELYSIMGDRPAVLSREMTKLHEEFARLNLGQMLDYLQRRRDIKGECTLLVGGNSGKPDASAVSLMDELDRELKHKDTRVSRLSKTLARKHGIPKNVVYKKAVKIKKNAKNRTRTTGAGA